MAVIVDFTKALAEASTITSFYEKEACILSISEMILKSGDFYKAIEAACTIDYSVNDSPLKQTEVLEKIICRIFQKNVQEALAAVECVPHQYDRFQVMYKLANLLASEKGQFLEAMDLVNSKDNPRKADQASA